MKKFLIIFLLFPFFVNSQILDIEKDRLKDDTLSKGFHGKISLSSLFVLLSLIIFGQKSVEWISTTESQPWIRQKH